MDALNPLSEDHLAQINAAIASADVTQQAISKAKLAGIALDLHEQQLQDALTRLRMLKQVYFPGR